MRNFLSNNAPMIVVSAVILGFCAGVISSAPVLTLAHLLAI